ncbi:MAG: tetratricopeptide repeat protein [Isosphaeraceae bacterium]|nr:tetratricopeptide repeat protein [Isosphaeraceae bacterium]
MKRLIFEQEANVGQGATNEHERPAAPVVHEFEGRPDAPRGRDTLSSAKRALNHRLFFRAETLLREAIKERPGQAEPWYLRGVLRELQGKPRAACEAYRTALRIEPGNAPAKQHLANIEDAVERVDSRRAVEQN